MSLNPSLSPHLLPLYSGALRDQLQKVSVRVRDKVTASNIPRAPIGFLVGDGLYYQRDDLVAEFYAIKYWTVLFGAGDLDTALDVESYEFIDTAKFMQWIDKAIHYLAFQAAKAQDITETSRLDEEWEKVLISSGAGESDDDPLGWTLVESSTS